MEYKDDIEITESAQEFMRSQLLKRGKGLGIRLGLRKSGCSGYKYLVEYVDQKQLNDIVITFGELHIFVDQQSMPALRKMKVDYLSTDFESGLQFINPNASAQCGCGESFSVNY